MPLIRVFLILVPFYLPIDILKIDGSYVRNITSDLQSQDFIKRLINLSEDLGIQTVAEFVENGKIAKFLINRPLA